MKDWKPDIPYENQFLADLKDSDKKNKKLVSGNIQNDLVY